MKHYDDEYQPKPPSVPVALRMPDIAEYNPLARLWQAEELDDYIERRKQAFDMLNAHYCNRTIDAIVDGKRRKICDICSPAYGLLCTVMEVHDTNQDLDRAA